MGGGGAHRLAQAPGSLPGARRRCDAHHLLERLGSDFRRPCRGIVRSRSVARPVSLRPRVGARLCAPPPDYPPPHSFRSPSLPHLSSLSDVFFSSNPPPSPLSITHSPHPRFEWLFSIPRDNASW